MKKCVSKFNYWENDHMVKVSIHKSDEGDLLFSLDSGNKENFFAHDLFDRGISRYLEESPYINNASPIDAIERFNRYDY